MAIAKLRGPAALTPRQKGFAVAALAAMLAPALIVGTKLVDWVNLSKHNDIAVALGPADVYGALRRDFRINRIRDSCDENACNH